jgi:hypothetical protein
MKVGKGLGSELSTGEFKAKVEVCLALLMGSTHTGAFPTGALFTNTLL